MLLEMGRSDTCLDDMEAEQRDLSEVDLDPADQKSGSYPLSSVSPGLEALVELEASMAAEHVFQRLRMASESQERQLATDVMEYGMRRFCCAFVSHFTRLAGGRSDAGERVVASSPGGWERSPTPLTHALGLEDSQSNASDISSASAPGRCLLPTIEAERTLLFSQDGDFVDGDLRDGGAEQQVRSKSDASPSQRSSFLRRMSFKSLTQTLNPFSKRHSQDRKNLFRVPTSGSLPISDADGNSPQMGGGPGNGGQQKGGLGAIRPRLASAPAADLTRIRPVSKMVGSVVASSGEAAETLSSSLFSLAGQARVAQRKGSLAGSSISSGRQSPVSGVIVSAPPPVIPEHEMSKKREEDLSSFAGFHPDATRNQSATLVQQGGLGAFLVRASETDPGKFVLTFNGQGRPKHLRFCINDDGRCRVQSTWFESLADMVSFYRAHPIPSESGHSTDATLSLMISRPLAAAPTPPPVATDSRQRSYTSPFAPEAMAARKGSAAAVEPLRQGGDYKMAVDPPLCHRRDVKGLF